MKVRGAKRTEPLSDSRYCQRGQLICKFTRCKAEMLFVVRASASLTQPPTQLLLLLLPILLLPTLSCGRGIPLRSSSRFSYPTQDRGCDVAVPQPSRVEQVAQWWGEWSTWMACSRTCGGGIMSQERHCLQQRHLLAQGGENHCTGSSSRHQLCNVQACPPNSRGFRVEQCSVFNSKAYDGKYFTWIPFYPDDYINISNKPCDLQCTTSDGERQLTVRARDGTSCKDRSTQGVCIAGRCEPVGCDGILYSAKHLDKCGVCSGDSTSCMRVAGNFRETSNNIGYVHVTNLPIGATDIQVIEKKRSDNVLAVSDHMGNFYINGNFMVDNPRNFRIAGTVFKYRRPFSPLTDGFEYIMATGPTKQPLNVMVLNENGKLQYVTYEYTVPRATRFEAPLKPPIHRKASQEGTENGVGKQMSSSSVEVAGVGAIELYDTGGSGLIADNLGLRANEIPIKRQEVVSWRDFDLPSGSRMLSSRPRHSEGIASRTREMVSGKKLKNRVSTADNRSVEDHHEQKGRWFPGHNDSSERETILIASAHLGDVAESTVNGYDVSGTERDISLADVYRWKVSAYAPCSSTCTTAGISTSYAICVRYDGVEVDEAYCDALTRPEPTHEFCTGRECQPRWETSHWSSCSRSCGEGLQFRTVRCWKMLAVGFDSSVYAEICEAGPLPRPADRKICKNSLCGPQWETSEWSKCSAQCGQEGVQRREVRCSVEESKCDVEVRPPDTQRCTAPPCDRRWSASEWGPCSGKCGEGTMQRHVTCRNASGEVIAQSQCDPATKPLSVYPCGQRECPAHWLPQEWDQCNATCGRGVRSRMVLCAGLVGGTFEEFDESECHDAPKPKEQETCFERPCSRWFTTSWSQCSKTCGTGIRVREVKCYQGGELGQDCDSDSKPDTKQSCELHVCPTEAPEDRCQDKASANCALVIKVKLCGHWYYRTACCRSCHHRNG